MGGDSQKLEHNAIVKAFQSTPPYGGRQMWAFAVPSFPVSIHAPVWGATQYHWRFIRIRSFNPRPRMGGDCNGCLSCIFHISFNPRPRMGGDSNHFNILNIRAMKHVFCEPTGEGYPQNSWKCPNVLIISGCECAWGLCITPCSHSEDNGFVHIV